MERKEDFSGVTHYTHVEVQPGGINIQNVERLYQADLLAALGKGQMVRSSDEQIIKSSDNQMIKSPDKQRGRKKEWLFMDSAGRKNSQLTKAKAGELLEYLADYGAEKAKVECRKDNVPCLTFLAFYHVWAEQGLVERTMNGGAAYRFLKEDCRLTVEHTEKTLSSFLKAHYDRVDQKRIDDVRKTG